MIEKSLLSALFVKHGLMKEFATDQENKSLKITDRIIALSGKDYHVWEAKAEHIISLYLTDKDCSLEVEVNILGQEDTFSVGFPSEIYQQVKEFFTKQLKNVKVRSLSRFRQMSGPTTMAVLFAAMTGIFAYFATQIEATGTAIEGGRKSKLFNEICLFLTEKLGFNGILLGGGGLTAVFVLFALKAFLFPKKGATVDFKYGDQVMNFTENS